MKPKASVRLQQIVEREQEYDKNFALPVPDQQTISAAAVVCDMAEALLEDIRSNHPGEDLHCSYLIALDEALACV
jgi:L-aminopeptidase/D-esterase-like protein